MRVGIGFDVHPYKKGLRLVLAGEEFDAGAGLAGHSDADVITHAVIDALLGAAAMGDIGQHFPDDDNRWKDARSLDMLGAVRHLLEAANFQTVNVDIAVVAEAPRIAPRVGRMRENIAAALGIAPSVVSIKATTAEKLGAIGRGEGMAAWAVALIDRVTVPESP